MEHFMKYVIKYIMKINVWDFHRDEVEGVPIVVILEDCINVSSPSTLKILSWFPWPFKTGQDWLENYIG